MQTRAMVAGAAFLLFGAFAAPAVAGHAFDCDDSGQCTAYFWHQAGEQVCTGTSDTRHQAVVDACLACTPEGEEICQEYVAAAVSVESTSRYPTAGDFGYVYDCKDNGGACTVVWWNRINDRHCAMTNSDPVEALTAACTACGEEPRRCSSFVDRLMDKAGHAPGRSPAA